MPRHRIIESSRPVRLLGTLLVLLTAAAATAQLPGNMQSRQPDPQQARLMELRQRLTETQDAALAANPELQAQRADLETLVTETMEEAGYDPEARMATLDSLRDAAQAPDATQASRMQMMQTAQRAQSRLQEAQQVAMRDSTVIAAQESFRQDLMAAMRVEDPETDALIDEFETLQQQMMSRMQQQPQSAPRGDGGR